MNVHRLGFLGFGHVGRALAELLERKRPELRQRYGFDYGVTGIATGGGGYIAAEPGGTLRPEAASPAAPVAGRRCADVDAWLAAARPDVVFEMSPTDARHPDRAVAHVRSALLAGAHVVSANKGPNLQAYRELADLAWAAGRHYLFEASCMGGVPIFSLFRDGLPAARLQRFRGLLNCTSSVVLREIERGGDLAAGVARARALGVAEADPAADLDGWDCAVKICAIGTVLMDTPVPLERVAVTGIRQAPVDEIRRAAQSGGQIRLVSVVERHGADVHATVRPERLEPSDPLFSPEPQDIVGVFDVDVLHGLTVRGHRLGADTTAYDLLADLVRAVTRPVPPEHAKPRGRDSISSQPITLHTS
jgi:homoserine dehydrogenase